MLAFKKNKARADEDAREKAIKDKKKKEEEQKRKERIAAEKLAKQQKTEESRVEDITDQVANQGTSSAAASGEEKKAEGEDDSGEELASPRWRMAPSTTITAGRSLSRTSTSTFLCLLARKPSIL